MRTPFVVAVAVCGTVLSTIAVSDPVLDWNSIMVTTTTTVGQNPFFQARTAAITQLAVFEAVNAIDQDFEPYLPQGTITARPPASPDAAAIAAAYTVLSQYFCPLPQNPPSPPCASLHMARDTSLMRIPNGHAKDHGIAVGVAAAKALIALRADDGSTPSEVYFAGPPARGAWQPTKICPRPSPAQADQVGVLLQWRNLRPFAIERTDQFRSTPPPALTSERYARDYNEVKKVGSIDSTHRSQHQADVAQFYAATAPVPVWNSAAQWVAVEQGRSMSENARALALMNVAIVDASASVFDTKYFYDFWRPETAIHASGDTTWQPFIVTPCFPSYGSAHASLSNAARKVLEAIYGPGHHFIKLSNPTVPDVTLQYETFEQITADINDARVYGGIHFRFDQVTGAEQGRQVGEYVYKHILRRANGELD